MSLSPKDALGLDAKWLVIASGFAAFAVVLAYDLRLGVAAGVLLVIGTLMWNALALWLSGGFRQRPSAVRIVSQRYEEQLQRRLLAERRARAGAAKLRSGPQQLTDWP